MFVGLQPGLKIMLITNELPRDLYRAVQVRELDRTAIEIFNIPGITLMERAGTGAFELLRKHWPQARNITVVCGIGNNGGDGYVVARLALKAGLDVKVLQLGERGRIQGDAGTNYQTFLDAGGEVADFEALIPETDLIVDGLFGTGLEREVTGKWAAAVAAVNRHPAPVLALDIPSGLHSDSGRVLGTAVRADATVSFIGLKRGMLTGEGGDHCGDIAFSDLEVPPGVYEAVPAVVRRIDYKGFMDRIAPRRRSAHKGDFGHLLVIGGERGFMGAARMAAEAGARAGAGLVSVATRPDHAVQLSASCPELMSHGVEDRAVLGSLLQRATVTAVGPGLGRSAWAGALLERVLESDLPLVVDADALNLLAEDPTRRDNWILTPHPGEAARLLGRESRAVQKDRFESVQALQEKYGGVIVLKGSGTLVCSGGTEPIALCTDGNPGMAGGGMGDLLTGIIAGLLAQGMALKEAAEMGVCLHGAAADRAARWGERGLMATDLLPELRLLLNPQAGGC